MKIVVLSSKALLYFFLFLGPSSFFYTKIFIFTSNLYKMIKSNIDNVYLPIEFTLRTPSVTTNFKVITANVAI